MSTNPQVYTDGTALRADLLQLARTGTDTVPVLLAFAGGSASGKTTFATQVAADMGSRALLFSQDNFQLGQGFSGRHTSMYTWDDPANFDLSAGTAALEHLAHGELVTVPQFDMINNLRSGTMELRPRPCILWEGIYAGLTPELRSLMHALVFFDAPFGLRLVRRISRFLQWQDTADISTPAKHMLTFVRAAEHDFVYKQKALASHILIYTPDTIASEIDMLRVQALRHKAQGPLPLGKRLSGQVYAGYGFALYEAGFTIMDGTECIYAAPLDEQTVSTAARYFAASF